MHTIYWLSILGQVIGFGVFILSIIGAHLPSTTWQETIYKEMYGPFGLYRWKYLMVGLVSSIVTMTI